MRGHVRKRGNKWCIVLYLGYDDVKGKHQYKWFSGYDTRKIAEADLPNKLQEAQQGLYSVGAEIETIESLMKYMLEAKSSQVRASTLESYERPIQNHIIPGIGKIKVNKLTPRRLRSFYTSLQDEKHLSNRSVELIHTLIHMGLKQAVADGIIAHNVADRVKPPRPDTQEASVWTLEQVIHFLDIAKREEPRYFIGFYLAAMTGMRKSEILALRWHDLNWDTNSLTVKQRLARVKRKPDFGPPKSKKSRRVIDLTEDDMNELKRQQERQDRDRHNADTLYTDNDLVLCKPDGRPLHPRTLDDAWYRALKASELPPITFHGLRHTHITLLLEQGENIKVISERAGHYAASFTMDKYAHVLPTIQRQAADHLSDRIHQVRLHSDEK